MSLKVLLGAAFSAAYCVVVSAAYYTLRFGLRSGEHSFAQLVGLFPQVFRLAAVPAAIFGFVLGGIGTLILGGFSSVLGKGQKFIVAAILGALLGCVPPASWPPPREFETPLTVLPCVVIGASCAMAWTLIAFRSAAPVLIDRP